MLLIEHLEINFLINFLLLLVKQELESLFFLGALGLIMGNRADLSSLKEKDKSV